MIWFPPAGQYQQLLRQWFKIRAIDIDHIKDSKRSEESIMIDDVFIACHGIVPL